MVRNSVVCFIISIITIIIIIINIIIIVIIPFILMLNCCTLNDISLHKTIQRLPSGPFHLKYSVQEEKNIEINLNVKYEISLVLLQYFVSVWVDHYLKLKTFPKTTFPSGIPYCLVLTYTCLKRGLFLLLLLSLAFCFNFLRLFASIMLFASVKSTLPMSDITPIGSSSIPVQCWCI